MTSECQKNSSNATERKKSCQATKTYQGAY